MTWSDPALERVASLFEERTGVVLPPQRRAGAELGIRRAMARSGFEDVERYRLQAARDHALFDDLVAELIVGETYFFREPDQFSFLRDTILPALKKRDDNGTIRAWSAGCATGEEAYSLAMALTAEGLAGRSHVLGTDLSRAALARARAGVYTDWSLRGEGADAARCDLERVGPSSRVRDPIRRMVAFEHLNLALDIYPSFITGTWGIDLIFCRNVLIYLDRETIGAVARRLFASLSEGGWLVTASSDPPVDREAAFQTVVTDRGVFYQRPVSHRRGRADVPGHSAAVREVAALAVTTDGTSQTVAPPRRAALGRGDIGNADDLAASVRRIRELANVDIEAAEAACADATARHRFSTELHYLNAVLLLGLGRGDDAARAARRVIYLDRTVATAHFLLGSIHQQEGDRSGARRAYRNARDLAAARPSAEALPLAEGETAGQLAERAARHLARLDLIGETRS